MIPMPEYLARLPAEVTAPSEEGVAGLLATLKAGEAVAERLVRTIQMPRVFRDIEAREHRLRAQRASLMRPIEVAQADYRPLVTQDLRKILGRPALRAGRRMRHR